MPVKGWSAVCLIGFACIISFAQSAQADEKPDKIAYKDGDGKWQIVAIKDLKKRDERKFSKPIKAAAGPTFNVTYLDVVQNTNAGFDDPVTGADRRATMDAVLFYFSTLLQESGQADVEVAVSQTDGTGPLGTGGSFFFLSAGFNPGLVYRHIITGTDPMANSPDAIVTIDFGYNYNNDLGPVGPFESDLFSLLLHEMTHVLGLASVITPTGGSELSANVYTVFDSYLYTGGGVQLINPTTFAFQAQVADLTSGNIEFRGLAATTTFGSAVPVYSPSPWSGSSLSHWADGITPEPVMSRALTDGTEKRVHQPFEAASLLDLGYHIGTQPEPMSVRSEIWKRYK